MTTIVNYGAGNLRSVENTLAELGAQYEVTNRPAVVRRARRIILPGVGHFGQMMRAMDSLDLRSPILEKIHDGTPFLGICVGLQCLFSGSEESPESAGLDVFQGIVKRFVGLARVPHMGWDSLERRASCRLLEGLADETYAYFAHSFYVPVMEATVAACTYIEPHTAVLERGNVFGVQFHAEKSGEVGLRVMRNFLTL